MIMLKRIGLISVLPLGLALLYLLILGLFTPLFHFNVFSGDYSYDPRSQTPDSQLLVNRPETYLIRYIENEITQGRTYPSTAASKLVKIIPIKVAANFYTDYRPQATVTVLLQYADNSQKQEVFRLDAAGAEGYSGLPTFSFHARYAPLQACSKESANTSYCSLQLS